MRVIFVLSFFLVTIVSCAPFTKEKYLKEYNEFMEEVSENVMVYTDVEWKKINKRYARFNNEWYNKFKDDLTWNEKMTIAGYKVKFNFLKAGVEIGNIYQSILKEDIDIIKKKIEYYIESDMESDLNKLLEEAKKSNNELFLELKKVIDLINSEKKR